MSQPSTAHIGKCATVAQRQEDVHGQRTPGSSVGVIARNYDEMMRWYERHLGFTVASEWTMPETQPGVRIWLLKRRDRSVENVEVLHSLVDLPVLKSLIR